MNTRKLPRFLRRKDWETKCPDCGKMCRLEPEDKIDQRRLGLNCTCGKNVILLLDRAPKRRK